MTGPVSNPDEKNKFKPVTYVFKINSTYFQNNPGCLFRNYANIGISDIV